MASPLRVLHVEDDPNDAAIVQSTLETAGITCAVNCVHRRDEFVAALEHGGIDLILSDYSMPAFDGMSALKIAQGKCPAIPLIFVSGTLGEERAIDSLKNGATDYVLKERLSRLVPAVQRAMQEAKERLGREQAEAKRCEYSSKLEMLSRRLVEVQETERRHLARELHDEIGQTLTVAQMNLQALLKSLGAGALATRLFPNCRASLGATNAPSARTPNVHRSCPSPGRPAGVVLEPRGGARWRGCAHDAALLCTGQYRTHRDLRRTSPHCRGPG